MKKLIPLLFLFSCSKDDLEIIPKETNNYTLSIDSVLTQNGKMSIPKDNNGVYHLKLYYTNSKQQTHRVTGRILLNGKEPLISERVEWESNLFWILKQNDTVAYITKSYINYYTGQFTIVKLPPLISTKDELVPTSNFVSYSGKNGEINNMIAPVKEMKGDTMILKSKHWTSDSTIVIYTKIILE
jgi:hypothetical protein